MRMRSRLAMGLVLLLAGAMPTSAQMTGGADGRMGGGMMGGGMHGGATEAPCPGMAGEAAAFGDERPWLSVALAHAKDLGLSPDQVKGLAALRDAFQERAARVAGEMRTAEAELRHARATTMEKAGALLTPEQQKKLGELGRLMGRMHGARTMGTAPAPAR